jgi:phosphocarrier protein
MSVSLALVIRNAKGLHARASAKFVATVERFDARATVTHGGQRVSGDSIMGLLTLAAVRGAEIGVVVEGREEAALAAALTALVEGLFGEGQ